MTETKGLTKRYCQECGGEIVATYDRIGSALFIIKDGKLVRDENDALRDAPGLELHCENDKSHLIEPPYKSRQWVSYMSWKDDVINYFYDNSLYGDI